MGSHQNSHAYQIQQDPPEQYIPAIEQVSKGQIAHTQSAVILFLFLRQKSCIRSIFEYSWYPLQHRQAKQRLDVLCRKLHIACLHCHLRWLVRRDRSIDLDPVRYNVEAFLYANLHAFVSNYWKVNFV